MKMEFIKPLNLIENATWDSRHLGIIEIDEDIEEIGDVRERTEGDDEEEATGAVIDNVGFDWRSVAQKHWNPLASEHLGTVFRYDPAYYRIQWTVERGIPGDSILFEVGGPGTNPAEGIGHRTHMEIIENAAGLENATSSIDSVWLPGFTGSSFLDVIEQVRVRVLGIYDPHGAVTVRMSLSLLGGMVVAEAQTWAVPKMVLTRKKKDLPREVTHPELSILEAPDDVDAAEAPTPVDAPPPDAADAASAADAAPPEPPEEPTVDIEAPMLDLGAVDLQALLTPMPGATADPPDEAMPADPEGRTDSLADALDSILEPAGDDLGED